MEVISYVILKLAWMIPLVAMIFVAYVIFKNKQSDKIDAFIKKKGIDLDAKMVEIIPDKYQRVNNKIVAVITVQYVFEGKTVTSKRGLNFYIMDKDKFEVGRKIRVRINPGNPTQFYYPDYRTY